MDKIKKEIFFLILCILSLIGSFLVFIFLQQYIPEYFIYINNNWTSGFTETLQLSQQACKIPLFRDKSIRFYKSTKKDFFNNEIINEYSKNKENILNYDLLNLNKENYTQCIKNRSNYFDTKLYKYNEEMNFENCKFIDSLNNTSCENYSNTMMVVNDTKYTEVVFGQGQPCFDPRFYNFNFTLNKTSYYYDKSKCPNGRTNKYYHILRNITLKDLLDVNSLKNLSLNDDIKSEILFIYARNYIGIKDECQNKPFNKLSKILGDVNNYISSSIAWMGYISLIEIAFFLLFINRFTVRYHNYINNVNKDDNKKRKELLPPYTKPVILILSLIQLGFHILVFTYFLNIRDFIDLFYDTSCLEEETGELINRSMFFLNIARFVQIGVLVINGILAFKYGIKKGIKYAN